MVGLGGQFQSQRHSTGFFALGREVPGLSHPTALCNHATAGARQTRPGHRSPLTVERGFAASWMFVKPCKEASVGTQLSR